jgi:hypothetical protein
MKVLIANRLEKMNRVDTDRAKLLQCADSAEFMEAMRDRMLPEIAAEICTTMTNKPPSKSKLRTLIKPISFVPWRDIAGSRAKDIVEALAKNP